MDESLRRKTIALGGLFVALVAVGLLLSGFYRNTARTRTLVIPFDVAECDEDDDCGLSNQVGCCPCEVGGGQGAVNTKKRLRLKAFLRRACRGRVSCVNVSTCRADLRPACKSDRCILETVAGKHPAKRSSS